MCRGIINFYVVYCVHRVRHSFPTRRSSDLARLPRPGRAERLLPPAAVAPGGRAALRVDRQRHPGHVPRDVGDAGDEADRKSTRLNSSHLVISYAVFCLKKKTGSIILTLKLK